MKSSLVAGLPAVLLSSGLVVSTVWPADPPARAVMVSIDGLMPAYYLRADELGLKIPTLRHLMKDGAHARGVVGVLPSVTYPSHTTLITGVSPRLHSIDTNTLFDPTGRSNGAWHWLANAIQVPTLVSAAGVGSLTTATVSWPVSVGIGSNWNLPEFWRPNSEHEIDLELLKLLSTPGLIDSVARHRGRPFPYPLTDSERVDTTVFLLETHRPALTLLHIFELDSAQHRHGPLTSEALEALEKSDANLGRILAAARSGGDAKDLLVAVVSDHGFLPISRTLKPNVLLRQAGLVEVDEKGKVTAWQAFFHSNGGTTALYLKDPGDKALLDRVRALIEPRRREPGSGIRDVLDQDKIAGLGGAAAIALVLNAHEGFSFSNAADGDWSVPSTSKGTHGYAPDREEMHAALVLSGGGFEGRGDLGVVPMTSIAATLARHLGLSLGPQAGPPIPSR